MSSSTGTVLVIGATGKVGSRITKILQAQSTPFLAASRSGSGTNGVKFDFMDRQSWDNPFQATPNITAVYLIPPIGFEMGPLTSNFIGFARKKGVKRFVFLSATLVECGDPAHGEVHQYLKELGDAGQVEWAVLRPSWFQENFSELPSYSCPIKEEMKVYSATGDGKVPFVSADDIAACAAKALTDPEPLNRDLLILGPELLTYADIASIIGEVIGKKVVHQNMSEEEFVEAASAEMPRDYAQILASMDTAIKNGAENRLTDDVFAFTGKQPKPFRQTAEEAKSAWL